MTDKENITAILECYFSGFKKEIIDSACNRILAQKHQAIFDAGYEQGYNEGTASHDGERGSIYYGGYGDGYKDGLNDAWKCAKKIICDVSRGGYSTYVLREEIFDTARISDIFLNFSVSEAIAKINEYEEKQKQADNGIKVGDEVVDGEVFNSGKGIVTFASPVILYVLWYDGSTGRRKLTDVKKTGRTFPKIADVLEQLKEENK